MRKYSIPYGKHVVVHEGDKITAGTSLCEGSISPADILNILGPKKVREYLVNEIQEVYRLQGVKIDDKHIEVIIKQMMQKVEIADPGNTELLKGDRVNKTQFNIINKNMKNKVNILIIGIVYLTTLFADPIRYLDEVFDDVVKTENVVYGNAPDLPFWFWVESNTVDETLFKMSG